MPTALAVMIGVVVALVMTWALFAHQTRRFGAALRVAESASS
jgi:hypothetical protein